jgi:hypothetical protein
MNGDIEISCPVRGEWTVVTGGRTPITNYHHDKSGLQRYAVDMKLKEGDSSGATIYAPVEGIVLDAVNHRQQGSAEPEGNIVIIEAARNFQVWLAHLKCDSVIVRKEESVVAGKEIARSGSTGSAVQAPLRIHAQKEGKPVVMRFGGEKRFLLRNDVIRN